MPDYRVRVVRVRRVVEDAYVTVTADDFESAIDAAYDVDELDTEWQRQDAETQNIEPDFLTMRQLIT